VIDAIFELLMMAGRQAAHQGKAGCLAGRLASRADDGNKLKGNYFFSLCCWIKDFSKYLLHPKTKSKTIKIEEETDGAHICIWV
jgi:hypothetical protein